MKLGRGAEGVGKAVEVRSPDVTALSDLGITRMQSHRWQTVARWPGELFKGFIAKVKGGNYLHRLVRPFHHPIAPSRPLMVRDLSIFHEILSSL